MRGELITDKLHLVEEMGRKLRIVYNHFAMIEDYVTSDEDIDAPIRIDDIKLVGEKRHQRQKPAEGVIARRARGSSMASHTRPPSNLVWNI